MDARTTSRKVATTKARKHYGASSPFVVGWVVLLSENRYSLFSDDGGGDEKLCDNVAIWNAHEGSDCRNGWTIRCHG